MSRSRCASALAQIGKGITSGAYVSSTGATREGFRNAGNFAAELRTDQDSFLTPLRNLGQRTFSAWVKHRTAAPCPLPRGTLAPFPRGTNVMGQLPELAQVGSKSAPRTFRRGFANAPKKNGFENFYPKNKRPNRGSKKKPDETPPRGEEEGQSLGDILANKTTQQLLITGALLSFTAMTFLLDRPEAQEISFQEFKNKLLEKGMVEKIEVLNKTIAKVYVRPNGASGEMGLVPNPNGQSSYKFFFNIGSVESFERKLEEAQDIMGVDPRRYLPVVYSSEMSWQTEVVRLAPTLLLFAGWLWFTRRQMGGGMGGGGGGMGGGRGIFSVGKAAVGTLDKNAKTKVMFKDVAGCDEAKAEVMEFVSFLKNPGKYKDLGGKMPKGALLVGPPGTGKTLLAKAIAGEAKVPFFSCAGSEFVEMFVGVGASRVRNLFSMARKAAPCIIFIDEFDALGASRTLRSGSGMMGGEESTNTINQMLTEMDGFEDNTGIVVLAATNRPAVLDEALTRPGRFDRILHLPLPGIQGRVQILQVHARNKSIVGDVDWERIARGCAGWTGADIMNLMNEAAITAIREGLENVEERHIVDALEKLKRDAISAGGQKVETAGGKSSDAEEIGPLLQTSICLHEAGRALIGYLTPYFDDLQKVTVFPGGRPTGHTSFVPQESHLESGVMTRGYLTSQMVVCLAGRAAEKLILGEDLVSTAATTHLADANLIARQMVMRFGFSERIGPVSLMGGHDEVYLRTDRAQVAVADISPETAEVVLEEVIALIEAAEAKAMYGLKENRELLIALSERLKKEHTLTGAEVEAMCEEHGAKPYWDVSLKGFEWDKEGNLVYPERPAEAAN
uniref:AAA+ ATPase domain-containing protein n=1 Tax=Pyramimonas obovata TaxID=1411642 RepID=A0A7S0WQC1_9CHLO|mmetsp:Transcript_34585/g.75598  ORF Transcript_34585/g.75598 Transcript_34585/m.75598 type:complete len:845 (+) Transcript_34585:294-2828(+)